MNEIIKAMEERRSIRKFKPDMPTKEDLEQIIEAGLYAANGMGKQATITIAVTNKKLRDRLSAINAKIGGWKEGFDPFYGAPAILIVLADKNWANRVYDGSLVMGNMMLAAHSLNLGSIWIHRAKEEFELPEYQELLKEIDKVKVLVDNEIAIENLTKFAGVRHYQIVTGDDGDDFYAIIAKEGIDEELDFNEKSGDVVVISSKTMGSNEELGVVLMKSFIFALTKQDQLPKEMIFYNEGIFLTTNEGDILNDLKYLESQGVDIVSCGTCLDFFNRKELLQVGAVTNMYDIVERMEKAEKVIKP